MIPNRACHVQMLGALRLASSLAQVENVIALGCVLGQSTQLHVGAPLPRACPSMSASII